MIALNVVLSFITKHWREIAGAAVIGAIVIGFSLFYGSWRMRGAKIHALEADLYAEVTNHAVTKAHLARAVETISEWTAQAERWNTAVEQLTAESTEYQNRLAIERRHRREALGQIAELEERVNSEVTSEDCETAVKQLANAVGWLGQ